MLHFFVLAFSFLLRNLHPRRGVHRTSSFLLLPFRSCFLLFLFYLRSLFIFRNTCYDYPFIIKLAFCKICCNYFDTHFVAHAKFAAASQSCQAVITLNKTEIIIIGKTRNANQSLAFMFNRFYPESKGCNATYHALEFFTEEILHIL